MPSPTDPDKRADWLRRLSESHKGKLAWNKGISTPEEVRAKLSVARKNRPPASDITRAKMSASLKGKKLPKRSLEQRKKISISQKKRYEDPLLHKRLSDARKGRFCGSNHPNWKGGVSFEPYCILFNEEFKERSRAWFDYICVECGTPQNGERHTVHHVNFNKMSCCDDTQPLFVLLCRSCHSKTNYNREYWEEYFTEMIDGYYQGKCYFSKEEMLVVD